MFEDELAFHERFTVCDDAAVPVPVRVCAVVEGWALLVNVRVALAEPALSGLKVTVNGTLCPAAIVTGKDSPPTENTELFVSAAVTVTLTPLAVRLPDAIPLAPSTTSPTPSVAGLTASCAFPDGEPPEEPEDPDDPEPPDEPEPDDPDDPEDGDDPPLLTPWHPTRTTRIASKSNTPTDVSTFDRVTLGVTFVCVVFLILGSNPAWNLHAADRAD